MKNKLGLLTGLALALVPAVALTSCNLDGGSTSSDFRITVSSESISKISKVNESEESSKQVYTIFMNASNNSTSAVTLKNTDFKVSVNGKEFSALYFVLGSKYSIEDGKSTYVITDKSTTKEIPVNEKTGESSVATSSFTLAFEEDITSNPTFFYNGNQIMQY